MFREHFALPVDYEVPLQALPHSIINIINIIVIDIIERILGGEHLGGFISFYFFVLFYVIPHLSS
jgi:hypothetical protein